MFAHVWLNAARGSLPRSSPYNKFPAAFANTAVLRTRPVVPALWRQRAAFAEIALYIGAYLVYLATRGLVFGDTRAVGIENGERIDFFQDKLGFLVEPGWQAWAIEHVNSIVIFLNWAYIITYWPVILTLAFLLFILNRRRYYFYRTVVLFNFIGALLVFMLFPVASPFAIPSVDLVDTIQTYGPTFYGTSGMSSYYNISAAMPSLHFSWTVILGVLLWKTLPGGVRLLGLLYPVLTFFAIVITGNHFIMDAVGGGLLAVISFGLVGMLQPNTWKKAAEVLGRNGCNVPKR